MKIPNVSEMPRSPDAAWWRWVSILSIVLTVHVAFNAPAGLYLDNRIHGFDFSLQELLSNTLRGGILIGLTTSVIGLLFSRIWPRLCFAVFFSTALYLVIGYELAVFATDKVLEGQKIDWLNRTSDITKETLALVGMIGIASLIPASARVRASVAAALYVSANSVLILIVFGKIWMPARDAPVGNPIRDFFITQPNTIENMDRYSTKKNAVVILIDTFQSDIVEEILSKEPDVASALSGFTFFKNGSGFFNYTAFSVPAILSGTVYKAEENIRDFFAAANVTRVDRVLAERGHDSASLGLWGRLHYVLGKDRSRELELQRFLSVISYRQWPVLVKAFLLGKDHDFLGNEVQNEIHLARASSTDLQVLDRMMRRMEVVDGPPQFKFVHFWGAHTPVRLNRDCVPKELANSRARYIEHAQCIMTSLASYLGQLKKLGVYDNSQIFITADHGTSRFAISEAERQTGPSVVPWYVQSSSHPTLMMKDVNAKGALRFSDAPVTLLDIRNTILRSNNVATDIERDLRSPEQLLPVVREFNFYDLSSQMWSKAIKQFERYHIRGDVRRSISWSSVVEVGAPVQPLVRKLEGGNAGASDIVFEISSPDGGDLECSFNGAMFQKCRSPHALGLLSDGDYLFRVRAVGLDGKWSQSHNVSFVVDAASPVIAYVDGPASRPHEKYAEFRFLISKPGVTFHCRLGNEEFRPCGNPHFIENLPFGGYRLEAKGVDRFGRESAIVPYIWESSPRPPDGGSDVIGKQTALSPPLPTFAYAAGPPAPLSKSTEATFRFALPPGLKIRCRMAHEPEFKDCANPTTRRGLALGLNHFEAKAVDATGWEGAVVPYIWEIAQP